MNIYLLRHCSTKFNREKRYYGKEDISLSSEGIMECDILKKYFKHKSFQKIYVSNRKRTIETLKNIFGESTEYIIDNRINELNFGKFEGMTYDEITLKYPKESIKWDNDWINYKPENGENYIELYNRVVSFFEEILNESLGDYLVVTHGGIIKTILVHLFSGNFNNFWKVKCGNGTIVKLIYDHGNLSLKSIINLEDLSLKEDPKKE